MFLKLCASLLFINFGLLLADSDDKVATARIPRGPLVKDNLVKIQGIVDPDAKSFEISLQEGGEKDSSNVGLHIEVKFDENVIELCSRKDGKDSEKKRYELVIDNNKEDTSFEIRIETTRDHFVVNINSHRVEFPYQVPLKKLDHVTVKGDVDVESVVLKSVSEDDLQKLEKKL